MEQNQIVLCDTNIIIEFDKGNIEIVKQLDEIGHKNLVISVITAGELLYGALNKRELEKIQKDLKKITIFNIDDSICKIFIEIMGEYSLSHNLKVPDGFIAATAIANNIQLFTLNKKDFKFIKGLKLYH